MANPLHTLASDILDLARNAGADAAEVYIRRGSENEVQVRNGVIETLQSGQPKSLGLRLWQGERSASTYATDLRLDPVRRLIASTLELVPLTDPVPESALAAREQLATNIPDLDLFDEAVERLSAETRLAWAREAEEVGRQSDPRITVSGGASVSDLAIEHVLATSHGFCNGYRESFASIAAELIADDAEGKKRNGSWYSYGRHLSQLESPAAVGRTAASRAVRQLGAAPVATQKLPVVFDPLPAASLVGLLFSVLTGGAVERRSSFVADQLGQRVAGSNVTLVDDPHLVRGPGSRPFDGEGLPTSRTAFIDGGELRSFALNLYASRRLGLAPTGHASRPSSGAPGESHGNLFLAPGDRDPAELIAEVRHGFYCEGMMGFGFNPATGDFSRGASGRMIVDGRLAQPVSEVTLSINFKDLLSSIDGIGRDLDHRRSVASPTFRVREVTLAGRG
jgi:PmbA protein